jgi:hypothetical protein
VIRAALLLLLAGCGMVQVDDGVAIPCPVPACAGWSIVLYTSPVSLNARSRTSGVIGFGLYYDNLTTMGN